MSSQEYKMQVIGASRRVETVITEISLTKDRSEVFDFERRAMEAASALRSPDRQRQQIQDAVAARLQQDET